MTNTLYLAEYLAGNVDDATVYINIEASGTDEYVPPFTADADTVPVDISVISAEVHEPVEVGTAYVDITVTSVEFRESVDSETVYIDLQAEGDDVYRPLIPWWDPLPDGQRKWFEITPRKWPIETATRFRVTVRGRI